MSEQSEVMGAPVDAPLNGFLPCLLQMSRGWLSPVQSANHQVGQRIGILGILQATSRQGTKHSARPSVECADHRQPSLITRLEQTMTAQKHKPAFDLLSI